MTDGRYDVLFEPVQIGPVTAPNRFYQVPHCNGMGHRFPQALAAMRGVKAEGGWGVVCTEEVEIHPSSDITPFNEGRLWDDSDIPNLALMAESVQAHGALAGLELVHQGASTGNLYSRLPPMGPSHAATLSGHPVQARRMTKRDIRRLRQWYRDAALRGKRAGFDIIYVYAGHDLSVLMHFLSPRYNDRSDEYGGCLQNRMRLLREVLQDTKEAVGDCSAVAVRLAVDELLGEDGLSAEREGHEIIASLAELPDLWDVNISSWANDSQTSRFSPEAFQEQYTSFVKTLTTKPVVGVGRFTSPDTMVSQIRRGVMDLIGAARPSIADPFLPEKIRQNRTDEIRECIGCNICVSSDDVCTPIRCTQNPTMGEEWRRSWHPQRIATKTHDDQVLVVGAGPAGLECALALSQRGHRVVLAEREAELGGRVRKESQLPGLSQWHRVVDYRLNLLKKSPLVSLYTQSELGVDEVRELGCEQVVIATGANWRRDGLHGSRRQPIPSDGSVTVLTPDNLQQGVQPRGRVVVWDKDRYYMGGVLAELCTQSATHVTYLSPEATVSPWTEHTLEQGRIQSRLIELSVELQLNQSLRSINGGRIHSDCVYGGAGATFEADTLVMVTERAPNDALYLALESDEQPTWRGLQLIGDAYAPGVIAAAVHSGHACARQMGEQAPWHDLPFARDKGLKA